MSKYFTTLNAQSGTATLSHNPCKLLDFQLLSLAAGQQFSGQTSNREVLAVILGGTATFEVCGKRFESVGARPNVFAGKPHAVYLPREADFTIAPLRNVEIALPSAPSELAQEPYVIAPEQVTAGVWGAANFSRNYHQILTESAQPTLPAQRLIVGETYTPSGNWSTYPPHKHERDDLPREAHHEEMYFFKVNPPDGFGIARYYKGAQEETNYTVRNNTLLMMPDGFHTIVSAPGYTTYYLWFLAGTHRTQAVIEDAKTAWVSRAVPMLRQQECS